MSRCSNSHFTQPGRIIACGLTSLLVPLALVVGASTSTAAPTIGPSVLDPLTDIATSFVAPAHSAHGHPFQLTLRISNRGSRTAEHVSCGLSEPPPGSVDGFALSEPTERSIDDVEGNASRTFTIKTVRAGKSVSVRIGGTSTGPTATMKAMVLNAYCTPSAVDMNQTNNAAKVSIALR